MTIKFSDIEMGFEFVSFGAETTHTAILCKDTGEIYYSSDDGEMDEVPDGVYENDDCIEIPHKNDLDLGRNLVFEFMDQYLPDDFERVRQIFRSRGAYARYKDLLDHRGKLKEWYDFENVRQTETLREWCRKNRIKFIE